MATFRFTAGPWNVHEGNETFGPGHRKSIPLEEKMKKYAEIGLAGMQFHDDDAVPDMNNIQIYRRPVERPRGQRNLWPRPSQEHSSRGENEEVRRDRPGRHAVP